jgi:hypothetical protein
MIVVLVIWVAVIVIADFINMPNNPIGWNGSRCCCTT